MRNACIILLKNGVGKEAIGEGGSCPVAGFVISGVEPSGCVVMV
jgi:hypothetical protein